MNSIDHEKSIILKDYLLFTIIEQYKLEFIFMPKMR